MLNSRAQRNILLAGLFLTLAQWLFPPWQLHFTGGEGSPGSWPEGFAFLLKPPPPGVNAYQYHAVLTVGIDWLRVFQLWFITLLMTAGFWFLFRKRDGEGDSSVLRMLERRKLLSSLLFSLGFPIPFLGGPVAYIAAYFLVTGVGFEGLGTLYLCTIGFWGLAAFSLIFLAILQTLKSLLARKIVLITALVTMTGLSIGKAVVDQERDHARQKQDRTQADIAKKHHDTAVQTLHDLNRALAAYGKEYGAFPLQLDYLESAKDGAGPDRLHAALLHFPLPKGIESEYRFDYGLQRSPGVEPASYRIYSERIDNGGDGIHFVTSEDGIVRQCYLCSRAQWDSPGGHRSVLEWNNAP